MVTKTSIHKGLFMGLDNYINYALKSLLNNPILEVLREIKITKILKQSNFVKRDVLEGFLLIGSKKIRS